MITLFRITYKHQNETFLRYLVELDDGSWNYSSDASDARQYLCKQKLEEMVKRAMGRSAQATIGIQVRQPGIAQRGSGKWVRFDMFRLIHELARL